jgi:DNA-binding Xre family transcriptional regulator
MAIALTPIRITLREARVAAGLTQVQLAKRAKVRQATVSDLETGKPGRIDLEVLDKLCRVLGLEPGDLLKRESSNRRGR